MPEQPPPVPRHPVVRQSTEIVVGRRPGDRHVRLARPPRSERVRLPNVAAPRTPWHPAVVFVYGFVILIMIGAILLALPIASAAGQWTPFLDALFTATSAVCLTGLVVVDTGTYWSGFGQAIILALIQIGGFGFMTSSTLLLLLIGRRVSLRERLLLREALGGGGIGSVLTLARRILIFTVIAEATGVLLLTTHFLYTTEAPIALWWGLFHAVSAFNNAGFDLVGDYRSLIPYNHNPLVLLTIATLFILGALSYTTVQDVIQRRRFARLALDSKLVLTTTLGLLIAGTALLLFTERVNADTLGAMDVGPRLLNAFFLSATRTAGFSTVDIGKLTDDGLLVLIALMFIGGSAGSTAGGIKVQTFSILFFAIVAAIRGVNEVQAFRRRVPMNQVLRAIAIALLGVAWAFAISFALNITERSVALRSVFEAVSAFSTVGLSTGITPETSSWGRVVLIVAMFTGRLGPLTLALALAARERPARYHWPEETIKLG
jgi:trk system potassium uptake protein TrkH